MDLVIESLEDVLPHIAPDIGIIHSDHGAYSVINYVYAMDTTFDTAIARECRGLKFDRDGRLIARPFHKFFNLGEKRPPEDEPWDEAHVVLDKLDGSMIHPAMLEGELAFMTRMGVTDQSRAALAEASDDVRHLSTDMLAAGFTPVFEFTSPENRIVLDYQKTELTLLAVRETRTGRYMPHAEVAALAGKYDISVVQAVGQVEDVHAFWTRARALEGLEGYVVAFESGHRLKTKADAYVLRHKALSGLAHEKNLLAWIAQNALDDVLPLLAPDAAELVQGYQDQVMAGIARHDRDILAFVETHRGLERKDFAARVKSEVDRALQPVVFRALDGQPPTRGLMDVLAKASGSETRVDAIRPLFGMSWQPPEGLE